MSHVRGLLLVVLFGAAQLTAQNLSFVTCPVVRDTKTVPCWLAEYKGETYYLGNQGGVAQDFYPPQLNHEVLVEGVVAKGPRVCGGVPLRPVKTSVFLEINRACNTILPAEDAIEAPQSPPRPPTGEAASWVRSDGPADSTLYFDFDNDFLSLHTATAVQRLAQHFQQSKASEIQIAAFRGSSKLSNGDVLIEQRDIAAARAAKVRDILIGLGVPPTALKVRVVGDVRTPDGINDPWSRKVTLSVKPVKPVKQ
jgi:outer membrane protein OmpA-like peptidoglycan-associated protein